MLCVLTLSSDNVRLPSILSVADRSKRGHSLGGKQEKGC